MPLYLDFAATAPVLPEVLDEMIRIYRFGFGNAGSRTHAYGQDASDVVEQARKRVATALNTQAKDVVFTSGATEANNLALLGLAAWGKQKGRTHIISTQIEHKAVLEPLEHLRGLGFEIDLVPVNPEGLVCAGEVLARVRPDTLLVSVMHVNNETGVVQPVQQIGQELAGTPVFFHVDAAQSFGKLVEELRNTPYDMLTVSSHKVYGPQGVGALVARMKQNRRPPLSPLVFGGGQERGIRPGTLPVALIAGFGVAAEMMANSYTEWQQHCSKLRSAVLTQLAEVSYVVNGSLEHSLPNFLNVSFPGVDSEALMLSVRDSIAISNGSACTSAAYQPSHVLAAMGLPQERMEAAVRLSWGPHLLEIDLGPLIAAIKRFQ